MQNPLLAAVLLFVPAVSVQAQSIPPARLLADIGGVRDGGSRPDLAVSIGPTAYFVADSDAFGRELFRTDGTPGSTRLVVDLEPGTAGSEPRLLAAAGGQLFFFAEIANDGLELHVSDGTAAGTRRIDLVPGAGGVVVRSAVAVGSRYLFQREAGGAALWVTDGTVAGTFELSSRIGQAGIARFLAGPQPAPGGGEVVYFYGVSDNQTGDRIFVTDGTVAGTLASTFPVRGDRPVNSAPGASIRPGLFVVAGGQGGASIRVWSVDLQAGGRIRAIDAPAGNLVEGPAVFDGRAVFPVLAGSRMGFATDGLSARAVDITGPFTSTLSVPVGSAGGALWVTNGMGLLRLDPGSDALVPVPGGAAAPLAQFGTRAARVGDRLYYPSVSGLVEIDAVGAASRPVFAGTVGGTPVEHLGRVLFAGDDGSSGEEPYAHSPAAGTTLRLANLVTGAGDGSSRPRGYVRFGARVAFVASVGGRPTVWVSDGTSSGLAQVEGLQSVSSEPQLFAVGRDLWIVAATGATERTVFATDGGTAVPVARLPSTTVVAANTLLAFGDELLVTGVPDGNRAAVQVVRPDGSLGTVLTGLLTPGLPVRDGDAAWILGRAEPTTLAVWRTTGTQASTVRLADLQASPFRPPVVFDGALWVSTLAGLFAVSPDGSVRQEPTIRSADLVVAGDRLFAVRSTAIHSTTGRGAPFDVVPFPAFLTQSSAEPLGSRVFFAASDATPWVTDGSTAGTFPLGTLSVRSTAAVPVGPDRLLFSAIDPLDPSRFALFVTDGTPVGAGSGTERLEALRVADGFAANGIVHLSVDDPAVGIEPFVLEPGALTEGVGAACGAAGTPRLAADRAPRPGTTVQLVGSAPGTTSALLLLGPPAFRRLPVPGSRCGLHLETGSLQVVGPLAAPGGSFRYALRIPASPALVGVQAMFQAVSGPSASMLGLDVGPGLLLQVGS